MNDWTKKQTYLLHVYVPSILINIYEKTLNSIVQIILISLLLEGLILQYFVESDFQYDTTFFNFYSKIVRVSFHGVYNLKELKIK